MLLINFSSFFFLKVWRLFTCFLFFGFVGIGFFFNMIFLYPPTHPCTQHINEIEVQTQKFCH